MKTHVAEKMSGKVAKLYHTSGIKGFSEEELVLKYAPLVLKMVYRIAPIVRSVVDFDDLKNVGYLALVQAARAFDPDLGVAFEVYCKHRVRGAILDELRRNSPVTRTVYSKWKKLEQTIQDLEEKLGHTPTESEIAAALGTTVNGYRELLDELRLVAYVSLDEISSQESDSGEFTPFQLADIHQVDPAGQVTARDLQELVRERILQMSPQQKKILTLYYYEGLRFKDIAVLMKLSESRICQIHTEAIMVLRAFLDREQSMIDKL
ncbi:MAG: FliA/WhiG family RNA polymerase sigma factor [Verrucomicrobia bacterium]|nr:FliA/WhiG family RNA polymerase sigma factor [Verrucomicrobiota bacterium]